MTFDLLKPYLIRFGALDEVTFDELYQHMLMEMIHEDFTSVSFGLTVWVGHEAFLNASTCLQKVMRWAGQMDPIMDMDKIIKVYHPSRRSRRGRSIASTADLDG